jgi:outer membrane protein assembly factor BamB
MDRSILVLQWHARLLAMALMAGMLLAFSGVAWAATALSDPSDPIPLTNGRVTAIALSGNMIYLGGSFTEVITPEGVAVSRSRLAAINADTGEVTDWAPHVSRPVSALAVDGTRLYLGGEFGVVNGAVRSRLALVDAITGALDQNWAPAANGTVRTLALSPDGGRLYAGGEFTTISGKTRRNLAALVASTGALDPTWPRDTSYSVYDVEALGRHVYVAGGGAGGNAAAFDASTGAPLWQLQGDGDFQAVAYLDGQVYFGGHFRVLDDGTGRVRLLSVAADTGSVSGWQPKANRGVWAVGADVLRTRIYTGGDFTKISDQPREGFAQFSVVP